MGWTRVRYELDDIKKAFDLPMGAWLRAQQNSYPDDFAVYSGFEFGKTMDDGRFVLYFTPKAADDCEDILMRSETEPCEEPDRTARYFSTAYRSDGRPAPTL